MLLQEWLLCYVINSDLLLAESAHGNSCNPELMLARAVSIYHKEIVQNIQVCRKATLEGVMESNKRFGGGFFPSKCVVHYAELCLMSCVRQHSYF